MTPSNITALPITGYAPDNASIAARLRSLADDIEGAGWGTVTHVLVLLHTPEDEPYVARQNFGGALSRLETAGLLSRALHDTWAPED